MSKHAGLTDVPLVRKGAAAPSVEKPPERPKELIAISVKLEPALYERLKMLGVRRRQSNQAIMVAALKAHLEGEGA